MELEGYELVEEGKTLLEFFRDEQEKRGHKGCKCSECEEDMANAIAKVKRMVYARGEKRLKI